jgi:hypothetical protein
MTCDYDPARRQRGQPGRQFAFQGYIAGQPPLNLPERRSVVTYHQPANVRPRHDIAGVRALTPGGGLLEVLPRWACSHRSPGLVEIQDVDDPTRAVIQRQHRDARCKDLWRGRSASRKSPPTLRRALVKRRGPRAVAGTPSPSKDQPKQDVPSPQRGCCSPARPSLVPAQRPIGAVFGESFGRRQRFQRNLRLRRSTPATPRPVPGTRYPVPGTRHPAPGTRYPAPGTRHRVKPQRQADSVTQAAAAIRGDFQRGADSAAQHSGPSTPVTGCSRRGQGRRGRPADRDAARGEIGGLPVVDILQMSSPEARAPHPTGTQVAAANLDRRCRKEDQDAGQVCREKGLDGQIPLLIVGSKRPTDPLVPSTRGASTDTNGDP